MLELAGIVVAFAVIIYLINQKRPLAVAMLAASFIVLLSSGNGPIRMAKIIWGALVHRDTIDLVLIVATITALASLLQKFRFFDEMVLALRKILPNDKITLMFIPGLVGCMPMTGGAIVSAPMVDGLGAEIGLNRRRRSAANLIFRHSWYFVFPFMPTFILAARLSGIEIYDLISIQWPLTAVMLGAGYYFILSKGHNNRAGRETPDRKRTKREVSSTGDEADPGQLTLPAAFWKFILYGSPIILGLTLTIGLGWHLALALALGMALALAIRRTEDSDFSTGSVPQLILTGIDYKIVAAMASIMIFRASVDQTTTFTGLMQNMLEWGVPLYLIAGTLATLVGYVSASHSSTLAVILPIISPVINATGKNMTVYVMLIYAFAFLTYLISPLHLCQILTNRYFDVTLSDVYRVYWPVVAAVVATAILILRLNGV